MKFSKCNNIIPDDSSFCNHCGNRNIQSDTENQPQKSRYFCSVCGGLIDPQTKQCTQCRKQHFKGFSTKTAIAIVLFVLFVISIIVSVILYIQNTKFNERLEALETENQQYYDYWNETFGQIAFFDEFVVFVEDDGTNLYHKYGCYKFKGDSFWAFNVEAAEDQEYEPCPYCCDAEPRSGTILSGVEYFNGSKITISASSSESCVVKLKTPSEVEVLSFYVRAGETVTVGVPKEYLYVLFASGDVWYGKDDLFGENTSYSKDDEICNFVDYTLEYTLYPVSSGNFSQTPIDEDEFR